MDWLKTLRTIQTMLEDVTPSEKLGEWYMINVLYAVIGAVLTLENRIAEIEKRGENILVDREEVKK